MKKMLLIVFNLIIASQVGAQSTSQNDNTNEQTYKLLFVGNSLTFTNNLPKLVKDQAAQKGIRIETTMIAKPNYAIVDHWAEGEVQNLIQTGDYDYVIIQQGPSSQSDGYHMLINGGREYKTLCDANDTQLVYFMVWPSRRYYHTFDGVIANYTAGAEANNAILSPVGQVWKDHFDATGDFSYYGPDRFHPSLKGSQVAADVIIESLFSTTVEPTTKNQQAWLIGTGNINQNQIHVENLYMTENGSFGNNFDPNDINNVRWGSMTIDFTGCHHANMTYSSIAIHQGNRFGSGAYPIERLAMNHAGMSCETFGFENQSDQVYFSGTFFGGPTRSGEGLNIDYLNNQLVLVSWFTYLPSNQTETGVYKQAK